MDYALLLSIIEISKKRKIMKASDYIVEFLKSKGLRHVYEIAGGMITHILDSLNKEKSIQVISVHHEQAAAFAADAEGRITRKPGIAFATSGPGATNLLTGIGSCFFDSSPAIFITGQVNTDEQKGNKSIRQLGFQETDIVAMAKPITKWAVMIESAVQLPETLEKAYQIAISGRPGPVLIDIPMNVQRENVDEKIKTQNNVSANIVQSEIDFESIIQKIKNAKRPLILAGRGIRAGGALNEFKEFLNKTQIPVVLTLLGLDNIVYDNPMRVGFIGSYGNRWANIVLGECDLLIVLGSRLDIRQTGADVKSFKENKEIIHVDCEEGEVNNRIKGCIKCIIDVKEFLVKVNERISADVITITEDWQKRINELKEKYPDTDELKNINGINPNLFIKILSKMDFKIHAYVADVGNHQMWTAQSLRLKEGQLFLTAGGMGAMGFALPASIGTSLSLDKKPVIVIAGDGGFQVNIQELQTIVCNKLPIKIIVLNNNCLGMIRQFQDSYFGSRYQSAYWGYSSPDFEKVGKAYGIDSKTISSENEIDETLKWFLSDDDEAKLLQVIIDVHTNAYPKLAFGKPITEMEPLSQPLDMEGT